MTAGPMSGTPCWKRCRSYAWGVLPLPTITNAWLAKCSKSVCQRNSSRRCSPAGGRRAWKCCRPRKGGAGDSEKLNPEIAIQFLDSDRKDRPPSFTSPSEKYVEGFTQQERCEPKSRVE